MTPVENLPHASLEWLKGMTVTRRPPRTVYRWRGQEDDGFSLCHVWASQPPVLQRRNACLKKNKSLNISNTHFLSAFPYATLPCCGERISFQLDIFLAGFCVANPAFMKCGHSRSTWCTIALDLTSIHIQLPIIFQYFISCFRESIQWHTWIKVGIMPVFHQPLIHATCYWCPPIQCHLPASPWCKLKTQLGPHQTLQI